MHWYFEYWFTALVFSGWKKLNIKISLPKYFFVMKSYGLKFHGVPNLEFDLIHSVCIHLTKNRNKISLSDFIISSKRGGISNTELIEAAEFAKEKIMSKFGDISQESQKTFFEQRFIFCNVRSEGKKRKNPGDIGGQQIRFLGDVCVGKNVIYIEEKVSK